jgi:tetratricopeptide (TPR) repeat protein
MLTGRPPFMSARPLDTVMQVLNQEPVPPRQLAPSIPADLETICLKALAKEPARRYAGCQELADDLGRFLRREPIQARPVGSAERLWRWCRRNPRVAIPSATAAASVLVALVVSVWSSFSLAAKNKDLGIQRGIAVEAKQKAEENARRATENAERADANAAQAEKNEQKAYRRAVEAKNTVAQMLIAIRGAIPVTEEKLRPVRNQLMQVASKQLENLPDSADDYDLSTGLEKARLMELQYTTSLELGEPSKAVEHLEKAEQITRERNTAQHTDATRFNLMTVLLYHAQARQTVRRDMELARQKGAQSVSLLEDILAHPNPAEFNAEKGSIKRLDALTQMFVATYQYARTLRKLGRVDEALAQIEKGLAKFDEAMDILRAGPPFKELPDQQWAAQKLAFRGMLADQDQMHALLLLSAGRADEARAEQDRILASARQAVEQDGRPGKFDSRQKLVQCLYFAGDVAKAGGDGDAARQLYEEALKLARELYDDNPVLELRRNDLNICLVRLAGLLRDKEPERAVAMYREALAIAQDMVRADDLGETKHVAVALALPFTGEHAEAAKLAESILGRVEHPDAELQIDMARTFGGCAWAAGKDDPDVAEKYRARAIELLSAAVDGGYRDRVYLAHHPDYDPLRASAEFQALLAKL